MPQKSWLKPSNLLILVVIVFAVILLVILPLVKVATYPLVSTYQQGQCAITAKQLKSFGGGDGDPTFQAHFEYTVQTASGQTAHGDRYDWFDGAGWLGGPFETGSTDRAGEQSVLDRYTIGKTYTCWYDPRAPSQAVLTRDVEWARLLTANPLFAVIALLGAFVVFAIVLIVVLGLVGLMRQGSRSLRGAPQPANAAGADERREKAAQALERLQNLRTKRDPSE